MISAPSPSRSMGSLVAAIAVLVAIAGAVLVAGVERPPELPALADHPRMTPPTAVAWTTTDDTADDRGPCLRVAEPDGALRSLGCAEGPSAPLVAWDDRGILQRDPGTADDELVALDPTTGDRTGRRATEVPDTDPWASDVETTTVDGEDRLEVRLVDAPDEPVAVFSTGSAYDVRYGATSPDGDWLALVDAADRLLVLPLDLDATEPVTPVVWAEQVTADQLVWEGSSPG